MVALRLAAVLITVFVVLAVLPYRESEAARIIGISIDSVCLKSSTCVDYRDIISYDNSSKQFSGKFIEKNGDYTRKCTGIKSSLSYYSFDKPDKLRILVDPCYEQRNFIPLITIVSRLDQYHGAGQMKLVEIKPTNETKALALQRSYSVDRWVDATCDNAVISGKKWQALLPDTIQLLKHDCDARYTKFNTNQTETIPLTKHDISTSYKAKDQKWRDQIKQDCLKARNACTELKQPTRGGL